MKSSCIAALALLVGIGIGCGGAQVPGETGTTPTGVPQAQAPQEALDGAPAPSVAALEAARTAAELGIDLGEPGLALGAPLRRDNLIVWPILAEQRADAPVARGGESYLTLDEAFASGKARVLETGNVNELTLENTADEPIFVLAGEVLQGGRQDRIVGRDLVVAPGEKAPLASFCVEQGRWSAAADDPLEGKEFHSANALAASVVRYSAQVDGDQSGVWAGTAAVNASNAVAPATGTYLATLQQAQVGEQVDELAGQVLAALERTRGLRGLVVAIDPGEEGELVCAEVFRDEALFRALETKLVRAYALDAVSRSSAREQASNTPPALAQNQQRVLSGLTSLGYTGGVTLATSQSLAEPVLALEVAPRAASAEVTAATPGLEHLHRTIYRRR